MENSLGFEQIENKANTQSDLEYRKAQNDLRENEEYLDNRKLWSAALLGCIITMLIFSLYLTILVGLKILIFTDEWLLRLIYISFFAEIIGLAKIVVDFLFPKFTPKGQQTVP